MVLSCGFKYAEPAGRVVLGVLTHMTPMCTPPGVYGLWLLISLVLRELNCSMQVVVSDWFCSATGIRLYM